MNATKQTFDFLDLSSKPLEIIPFAENTKLKNIKELEIHGIEETKDLLLFLIKLFHAFRKSLTDSKITISDLQYFLNVLLCLPSAIGNISDIPQEISDLSQSEINELVSFCITELSLNDGDSIRFLDSLLLIVNSFRGLF